MNTSNRSQGQRQELVVTIHQDGVALIQSGPMFYAGTVGLRRIYDCICEFERDLGARWKPARLLQRLAAENKSFRDYDAGHNT